MKTLASVWEQLTHTDKQDILLIVRLYKDANFPLGALPFISLAELAYQTSNYDLAAIHTWQKTYGTSELKGALVIRRLMQENQYEETLT